MNTAAFEALNQMAGKFRTKKTNEIPESIQQIQESYGFEIGEPMTKNNFWRIFPGYDARPCEQIQQNNLPARINDARPCEQIQQTSPPARINEQQVQLCIPSTSKSDPQVQHKTVSTAKKQEKPKAPSPSNPSTSKIVNQEKPKAPSLSKPSTSKIVNNGIDKVVLGVKRDSSGRPINGIHKAQLGAKRDSSSNSIDITGRQNFVVKRSSTNPIILQERSQNTPITNGVGHPIAVLQPTVRNDNRNTNLVGQLKNINWKKTNGTSNHMDRRTSGFIPRNNNHHGHPRDQRISLPARNVFIAERPFDRRQPNVSQNGGVTSLEIGVVFSDSNENRYSTGGEKRINLTITNKTNRFVRNRMKWRHF